MKQERYYKKARLYSSKEGSYNCVYFYRVDPKCDQSLLGYEGLIKCEIIMRSGFLYGDLIWEFKRIR